jgi:hypothetical protein
VRTGRMIAWAGVVSCGCAGHPPGSASVAPSQCAARVLPQQAIFTFPATPAEEWPVNQPITERFQSTVEYGWAVSWSAPEGASEEFGSISQL